MAFSQLNLCRAGTCWKVIRLFLFFCFSLQYLFFLCFLITSITYIFVLCLQFSAAVFQNFWIINYHKDDKKMYIYIRTLCLVLLHVIQSHKNLSTSQWSRIFWPGPDRTSPSSFWATLMFDPDLRQFALEHHSIIVLNCFPYSTVPKKNQQVTAFMTWERKLFYFIKCKTKLNVVFNDSQS